MSFEIQDLFEPDLDDFSLVVCFLLPATLADPVLGAKLRRVVDRGFQVCSFVWPVLALSGQEVASRATTGEPGSGLSTWYLYGPAHG